MLNQPLLRAMVLAGFLSPVTLDCFADGPVQHSSQKYSSQKSVKCSDCGHRPHCFWDFWNHCKLQDPPYLPVVQSQAMQVSPPVSDALQMRLQVEKDQRAPPPAEANQGDGASQKPGTMQKSAYQSASYDSIDERFNHLERKVELLLDKMDGIIQRESGLPRSVELNATPPSAENATRVR